jgi:GT2 family glycosyltransferase
MRASDDHWISYPNHQGIDIPLGAAVETKNPEMAGQTLSGWCFMLRGEAGLRFDEQFEWWYGDSDLQRQVEAAGGKVVCIGGCHVEHHDPLRSTVDDPERLMQARADEVRFAEKWGVDPAGLWLAKNQPVPA